MDSAKGGIGGIGNIGVEWVERQARHPAAARRAAAPRGVRCAAQCVLAVEDAGLVADQHAVGIAGRHGDGRDAPTETAAVEGRARGAPMRRAIVAAPQPRAAGPQPGGSIGIDQVRHDEQRGIVEAADGIDETEPAVLRASERNVLRGGIEPLRIVRIDRDDPAVAAEDVLPGVRTAVVVTEPGTVVLRAAKIGMTVGRDCASVELRGAEPMDQFAPAHALALARHAQRTVAATHGGARVVGHRHAAVVGAVKALVRHTVVAWIKCQRVLVRMHVALAHPRTRVVVAGETEAMAAVVGTEHRHAAHPHDVGIERIGGDGIVVPARAVKVGGRILFAQVGAHAEMEMKQTGAHEVAVGIAQRGVPVDAAIIGAKHRMQRIVVVAAAVAVAIEARRNARGDGIDHVLIGAMDGELGAPLRAFRQHATPCAATRSIGVEEHCGGAGSAAAGRWRHRIGQPVTIGGGARGAGRQQPVARRVAANGEIGAALVQQLVGVVGRPQHLHEVRARIVAAPHATVRRHIQPTRIVRARDEIGDIAEVVVLRGDQRRPALATVERLDDAGAGHRRPWHAAVAIQLASAGVHHVRITDIDQQRADVEVHRIVR